MEQIINYLKGLYLWYSVIVPAEGVEDELRIYSTVDASSLRVTPLTKGQVLLTFKAKGKDR